MNKTYQEAIDERLSLALENSNYRLTLIKQKENAKLKLENNLSFSKNGGLFRITPELLSLLSLFKEKEQVSVLDLNNNPILLDNLDSLITELMIQYSESMLIYQTEINKIKSARTTAKTIDW